MILKWFETISQACGMIKENNNPFGCGEYYKGTGATSGYAWTYVYSKFLSVAKCDLRFTQDVHISADENVQYLGMRLDYAHHLPPGKVTAFVQSNRIKFDTVIKRGTHMAYTEVIYTPEFYREHFKEAFKAPLGDPIEVIQNMGSEHHWSAKVTKTLVDIKNCASTGHAAELFYTAKSYELMSALIDMKKERLPHSTADYEAIKRVLHYIEENFQSDIRQADIVQIAHMSATKLKTVFKNFTGSSISDYILEKRMDHSAHLLSESNMNIEEIALDSGFATVSGFSTSFRKQYGVSPSNYRKQIQFNSMDSQEWFDTLEPK